MKRTRRLADYCCRRCHCGLEPHRAGWWCPDCQMVGAPRMHRAILEAQAQAATATVPVVATTGAALAAGLKALYADPYDQENA